jgi:hypothetical protein
MRFASVLLIAVALAGSAARAEDHGAKAPGALPIPRTPSPEGSGVYIISPANGATLSGQVTVRFGLRGMGIAPAGVPAPGTGHHHLILDASTPSLETVLPTDEHHLHFGKGQTEVTLDLPAGTHTLQLVFADQNHVPHQPPLVSERITITVK